MSLTLQTSSGTQLVETEQAFDSSSAAPSELSEYQVETEQTFDNSSAAPSELPEYQIETEQAFDSFDAAPVELSEYQIETLIDRMHQNPESEGFKILSNSSGPPKIPLTPNTAIPPCPPDGESRQQLKPEKSEPSRLKKFAKKIFKGFSNIYEIVEQGIEIVENIGRLAKESFHDFLLGETTGRKPRPIKSDKSGKSNSKSLLPEITNIFRLVIQEIQKLGQAGIEKLYELLGGKSSDNETKPHEGSDDAATQLSRLIVELTKGTNAVDRLLNRAKDDPEDETKYYRQATELMYALLQKALNNDLFKFILIDLARVQRQYAAEIIQIVTQPELSTAFKQKEYELSKVYHIPKLEIIMTEITTLLMEMQSDITPPKHIYEALIHLHKVIYLLYWTQGKK